MPSADRTHTSARRNIQELINGSITYGNTDIEKELRASTDQELINKLNSQIGKEISPKNKHLLEEKLSHFRNLFEENTGDNSQRLFERFIFMLGFKKEDITVKSNGKIFHVEINNIQNVMASILSYRKRKN